MNWIIIGSIAVIAFFTCILILLNKFFKHFFNIFDKLMQDEEF